MTGVVLGLVEAGSSGWSAPITVVSLVGGAALIAAFVKIEANAAEPILPLRVLANQTRAAANGARGLGYAGMYGMVFFLSQFLQDVQGRSALVTGLAFLPTPMTVFLSSQLTSRVLIRRLPVKAIMILGSMLSAGGLALLTQLHAGTSYAEILCALVLIGAGMGTTFVSLTTAALHGVAPADAGAASGLINVMQQLGAALGLAVLVTVFDSVTNVGAATSGLSAAGSVVQGIDVTFAAAVAFALAALAIVVFVVRTPSISAAPEIDSDRDSLAVRDGAREAVAIEVEAA
jgi:predicted MFS family arabinose efflux permease